MWVIYWCDSMFMDNDISGQIQKIGRQGTNYEYEYLYLLNFHDYVYPLMTVIKFDLMTMSQV